MSTRDRKMADRRRSRAKQLNVRGYVHNLSNGNVKIIALEEVASVDSLIE